MDKLEEEGILLRFKENCKGFPFGNITHPDNPDFIIENENLIGIEITQVFKDQDSISGSLTRAKETFRRILISNIASHLNSSMFAKCIVAVHLNDNEYSKKLNARSMAKLCYKNIFDKHTNETEEQGEQGNASAWQKYC